MSATTSKELNTGAEPLEATTLAKVTWRLIPFLFILYVINLVDRANIGIAKLQMLEELDMDDAAYGTGAGIFYLGYLLFEVPSNLILARTGARTWIARILITWGIVSSCFMFVQGPKSFYTLRVLLGVAEAGFFPGIILYLSQWFPARARAAAVAKFMIAGLIASIVSNSIGGLIVQHMDKIGGLSGWQWVFFLEGIPAMILGVITFYYLTDRPEDATWLTDPERNWLVKHLADEKDALDRHHKHTMLSALFEPRVWLLIGVYFTVAMGDNCIGFFLPSLLTNILPEWTKSQIGYLAAGPNLVALFAMLAVGRNSDRTGERRWHVACSAFAAAGGWLIAATASSPLVTMLGLTLAVCGMKCMLPIFWTLPTMFLTGTAAAGGIALINSVANIGGILGPTIMGHLKKQSGDFQSGYLMLTFVLFAGGILVLFVRDRRNLAAQPASSSR